MKFLGRVVQMFSRFEGDDVDDLTLVAVGAVEASDDERSGNREAVEGAAQYEYMMRGVFKSLGVEKDMEAAGVSNPDHIFVMESEINYN